MTKLQSGVLRLTICMFALFIFAGSAFAASFTYKYTMTPKSGTVGGTVLVTFDTAIPATGYFDAQTTNMDTATSTKLLSLTATLTNGLVFTLANYSGTDINFNNGQALGFSYYANSTRPALQLQAVGPTNNNGYLFSPDYTGQHDSSGTLVFNGLVTAAATPEPASLMLLGTGLISVTAAVRRKRVV